MKKLLLCSAALLVLLQSAELFGQSKTKFGIQAGATMANITAKYDDEKEKGDYKTGMTFGILMESKMSKNFSFQPALNFTQKGMKDDMDGYKSELIINYLELPLNFLYQTTESGKGRFFAGAGPSMAYVLNAKAKVEMTNGESEEEDAKIGTSDDDDLLPLDFGVNFLAGYQLPNGLFISGGYNIGLSNTLPGDTDGFTMKNQNFSLRIGFLFGKNGGVKK